MNIFNNLYQYKKPPLYRWVEDIHLVNEMRIRGLCDKTVLLCIDVPD